MIFLRMKIPLTGRKRLSNKDFYNGERLKKRKDSDNFKRRLKTLKTLS